MAAQASPLPDSIQRFQHLRRRVDARRDPDRREWTSSGSGPPQFPKTHFPRCPLELGRIESEGDRPRPRARSECVEAGQWFSTHDRLAASALRFLIDWKQHIAFALVITFRMKWARSSNLRRMISLDRNPGFAERNRLSAKASRLRRRAIGFARARPLRHRARVLCDAARSSGQLDFRVNRSRECPSA